jgi:hypothetical protein
MDNACLVYNLNVVIKAKDPPWFAGLKGSVADSVAANIDRLLGLSKPFAKKMIVTTAFFVFSYFSLILYPYIYYNVYVHGSKSLLSKNAQNLSFLQFFLENIWRLWIFCIPLHSLSNKRKQPNNVGYEA